MHPGSVTIVVLLIFRSRRAQVGVRDSFVPPTCTLPCRCRPVVASLMQAPKLPYLMGTSSSVLNACLPHTMERLQLQVGASLKCLGPIPNKTSVTSVV